MFQGKLGKLLRSKSSFLISTDVRDKFYHVRHPDNEIYECYGRNGDVAKASIQDLVQFSWDYQFTFFSVMLTITSVQFEKTGHSSALEAVGVYFEW